MSKLKREVEITTISGQRALLNAVFDTGSFYTIVREDRLPVETMIFRLPKPLVLKNATQGSTLEVTGYVHLQIRIVDREINEEAMVAPALNQDLLIGAKTMQGWDISIINHNGSATIRVGHDMHEPDIQEVD